MKDRRNEQPNYFPRLPFVILACAGIIILGANALLIYIFDDYPLVVGIAFFSVYSFVSIVILAVQSSKYNYINDVNRTAAEFNTEVMDMFKYVTDLPYAVIDGDGNAVIANNALQSIIGVQDRPILNRPLADFCQPYIARAAASGIGTDAPAEDGTPAGAAAVPQGAKLLTAFDIILSSLDKHGQPIMKGRERTDMSTLWSYNLDPPGGIVKIADRRYEPRAHEILVRGKKYYFTVFTEIDDILEYRDRMKNNNVVIAYIVPDNLQQIDQNFQSGYREAAAKLEATLRRFARSLDGFLREYERDKYMLVFTHEKLDECRENNYRILSEVRSINVSDSEIDSKGSEIVLTVSIGIADINDTIQKREEAAKHALEIAIRRGGDQVVTNTGSEIEYYGGSRKETMGNTVIDAKNAALQVWHHIHEAESVFIMGHSFPDFDSIASCIGIARAAYDILTKKAGDIAYDEAYLADDGIYEDELGAERSERLRQRAINARRIAELSVRSKIKVVVDRSNPNFTQFYDMLMRTSGADDRELYKKMFVGKSSVTAQAHPGSLLIITDVSNYAIVESPELIQYVENIVIIDHHRSASFSVEPVYKFIKSGASSASEIVASMIEHGNIEIKLTKSEATLMLAGIMLDTGKFSRNTTDLTFAAAQYLIRCEADQDEARDFFLDKYTVYKSESRILGSDVEIHRGIAIAKLDIGHSFTGDDRVAASKAADRLIGIQGIEAAFTLTKGDGVIGLSARSRGKINVQRIAERLGGGGHYNMAGAQIKDLTLDEVYESLKKYIDEYLDAAKEQEKQR